MKKLGKVKKRYINLVEVLVASSLLTVLLVALLGIYYNTTLSYSEIQKTHQEAFNRRYMQNRLTQLFSHIPQTWQEDLDTFIFTSQNTQQTIGESLIFSYDSQTDSLPMFSGYTIGRLYVNPKHQLCLAVWPGAEWQKRKPDEPFPKIKNEVLLDNVESITFRFYAAPAKANEQGNMAIDDGHNIPRQDSWENPLWKHQYKTFPAIVHLSVTTTMRSQVYEYQFVLPYIKSYIEYRS